MRTNRDRLLKTLPWLGVVQPALSPTHQAEEEEEHGAARADPFNLPHSVEQPAARTHTHTLSHSHTLTLTLAHTLASATKQAVE